MLRFRGALFAQNEKRRPSDENRRSICSSLPRDHPPCGTPVPEGTLFIFERLYHKPPTMATNWTRFALELASQHADPPGAPVEGGCGHRSRSQQPGHGRVGPARQRGGRMAPLRWGVREPRARPRGPMAEGTVTMGAARRRREECPLTPKKRPGPPLQSTPRARRATVGATPRGCPIQSTSPNTSCFGTNVPHYG